MLPLELPVSSPPDVLPEPELPEPLEPLLLPSAPPLLSDPDAEEVVSAAPVVVPDVPAESEAEFEPAVGPDPSVPAVGVAVVVASVSVSPSVSPEATKSTPGQPLTHSTINPHSTRSFMTQAYPNSTAQGRGLARWGSLPQKEPRKRGSGVHFGVTVVPARRRAAPKDT